ncbi:hypothetical protein BaRGS_00021595 [Batillaria attramentaria]|uniref:Uncharacterized protein n=1 Tax=Batillaria attramentaria TaxID=370345 RepID=A0ABD0KJ90_9CAEN
MTKCLLAPRCSPVIRLSSRHGHWSLTIAGPLTRTATAIVQSLALSVRAYVHVCENQIKRDQLMLLYLSVYKRRPEWAENQTPGVQLTFATQRVMSRAKHRPRLGRSHENNKLLILEELEFAKRC